MRVLRAEQERPKGKDSEPAKAKEAGLCEDIVSANIMREIGRRRLAAA